MISSKREQLERKFLIKRELKIRAARESFWEFCRLLAPEYYKLDRWHLWILCEILQALYEKELTESHMKVIFDQAGNTGELVNNTKKPSVVIPKDVKLEDILWFGNKSESKQYKKLMLNMPPRHGKSRTLIMFCAWIFGKENSNKVITCSYNDDMAQDFSRYTRDEISREKNLSYETIYRDVFPCTTIKQGDSSYKQWSLTGQFFNYKGAGIGGSITGKGCDIGIIDDPIKSAEEAYNENSLDKVWRWYTGTFLSRLEEGASQIANMTRWAKGDLCGHILDSTNKKEWAGMKLEAKDKNGNMLCPELMSEESYNDLKVVADELIFAANYHQQPIDVQGVLYKELKIYKPTDLLRNEKTNEIEFEHIYAYGDTADEGSDYLCVIAYGVIAGEAYILDVYYTKEGMEVTEPATAKLLYDNNVNDAQIESNNGGRGFARNVRELLWSKHQSRKTAIRWFSQSKNKMARILSNSTFVMHHIYFPYNWNIRWPEFYKAVTTFQREGKNKNDDAQDTLTGIAERLDKGNKITAAKRL